MTERTVPFKSWVLTPGYAPKEIELVEADCYAGYFSTAARKHYHTSDLYESKQEAIEAGWRKLDGQLGVLRKRAEAIEKKKATLAKHSNKP
ncbi:hypothetical protein [Pseudomonas gingeri]